MLRLSTKGRYGTRLMLNLAQHHGKGNRAVILKDVSAGEDISIRYLEQIIIPLKIGRLVKSIRGAGGGYTLARNPEDIRLSEILQALEGNCCLVECVEDSDFCDRIDVCPTFDVWKGASDLLRNYFQDISLRDLVERADKKKRAAEKTRAKAR
jgi:Rrf2 family cysteine metabolism transcriptional repressor